MKKPIVSGHCQRLMVIFLLAIGLPASGVSTLNGWRMSERTACQPGNVRLDVSEIDRAAAQAIRALTQFERRTVKIYAIGPELLSGIIVGMQALDKADVEVIERFGLQPDEPFPDFLDVVLQIAAAPSGARYEEFRSSLAKHYHVDPKDFDDAGLHRVYDHARSLVQRRRSRATGLYLVASSERKSKPLALIGTRRDGESGEILIVSVTDGSSMRALLDSVEKNGFRKLGRQLATQAPRHRPDDRADNATLRQIWPEP